MKATREQKIAASKYIHENRKKIFLGSSHYNAYNYYNVNGTVWKYFHEGLGTYPEPICNFEDFKLPTE